ncbi:MAG: hypothetical protein KatS3mg012_0311 [Gaiellaceae bacterium]|nr:MAG: hypothetical protein KatS3mg012_0311 [Gaiellaceae bacterium]
MPHTSGKRYAVVSCHVERPLDDRVWERFASLQERRPGGFRIAALVRPADPAVGEDERLWLERARAAASHAALGHHTHWTAPDYARPTAPGAAERVRREAARLTELGLEATLFCGGGWYTDEDVAEACAALGYVDCTPRALRPPALGSGERWAQLAMPARLRLPSGAGLLTLPTTHSLGDLARALARRSLPRFVHVYFHDTDLLDLRRRALVYALLPALARVAVPADASELVASLRDASEEIAWNDVARL